MTVVVVVVVVECYREYREYCAQSNKLYLSSADNSSSATWTMIMRYTLALCVLVFKYPELS